MMNRPRPRKIVSVIKTSPSAETIEEKPFEEKPITQNPLIERKLSFDSASKPQSPVVPSFSSGITKPEVKPLSDTKPTVVTQQTQQSAFVPRKPVVATLKKAHVPPPPTFSDSPKSSPVSVAKNEKIEFKRPFPVTSQNSSENKPLSPKSSGEAFLDAADKAADFIGGALLNSFKSFNLTDTTSVKMTMTSSNEPEIKKEEDPFADIMKKLKSQQAPKSPIEDPVPVLTSPSPKKSEFVNLMDEEPPETFKQFNEPSENIVKSPIKTKQPEPSSFIKAAFSPKPKAVPVKIIEKETIEDKANDFVNEPVNFPYDSEITEITEISSTEPLKQDFNIMGEHVIKNIDEDTENATNELGESELITEKETDLATDEEPEELLVRVPSDSEEDQVKVEQAVNNNMIENDFKEQEDESLKEDSPESKTEPLNVVYESKPVINFDGSVSSGPINVFEQVSSTSTIPFFDSLSSIISSNSDSSNVSSPTDSSSIKSPISPQPKTTGFRASILKHGLSALEKIGKSTADVVVSTRNKLAEPSMLPQFTSSQQTITPDFTDENSSFYDILKLYGGYTKLQELQLKGVRASISMKLARKNLGTEKASSFDYQSRLKIRREISSILHPDRIMENTDDNEPSNLLFSRDFEMNFPNFSKFDDEIFCIQKLLKSLDNILIISDDEDVLTASNRRRHAICQISTVFVSLLQQLIQSSASIETSKEISIFTAQIIKYLQKNFARNCDEYPRADRDQQLAIKLFLDISYSTVPQLQLFY